MKEAIELKKDSFQVWLVQETLKQQTGAGGQKETSNNFNQPQRGSDKLSDNSWRQDLVQTVFSRKEKS